MYLKNLLLTVVAVACCNVVGCNVAFCQEDSDTIPFSSRVVMGTLPNGLTYFIQANSEPKNRADFYIIRKVGALVENDDQNGLAHFLEHMAFNGTDHFPDKGIINMLERHGVDFGRSINAYTTQTETVYTLFNIPTEDAPLIDSCLLVLHDWSHYLTLSAEEIDAERGVICEEWRTRNSASRRMSRQITPVMLKGSKYAERDVIGDTNIIKNFEPEVLRAFYYKWYRPDLEAIAIVGDIDPEMLEEKIRELFVTVPMPEDAEPLPRFDIPEHDEIYYVVATDKEATQVGINVITLLPPVDSDYQKSYGYLRENLLTSLIQYMINARMAEERQKPDAPFIVASIRKSPYIGDYDAYALNASARPGVEEQRRALEGVLRLSEQIQRFGFNEGELEAARAASLAGLESANKEKNKISNGNYMRDILAYFTDGDPIMEFDDYYNYAKRLYEEVTLEDIDALVQTWKTNRNMTVAFMGPEDEEYLTEEEVLDIIESVESDEEIEPYEDKEIEGELIEGELDGSYVVKEKRDKKIGAVEWRLSNGARVIYKHADYEKDQVALNAWSVGGYARYDIELLPAAHALSSFVEEYGLGNFSRSELRRKLAGINAGTSLRLGNEYERVSGNSTPKDVETMFQLLYLRFENPRFDSIVFKTQIDNMETMLASKSKNPNNIMSDSINRIFTDYNPRYIINDEETIKQITLERIDSIYHDRFRNASDFTFFIVGNVEEDTVRHLAERYIGSIGGLEKGDKLVYDDIKSPTGETKRVIELPFENNKASVFVNITKKMKESRKNSYTDLFLSTILMYRYLDDIREKEGGTYGVQVSPEADSRPSKYGLDIEFECDPDRAEYLKSLIYKGIDSIAEYGPTDEEVDKIRKNMLYSNEQSKAHNSHVMSVVYTYYTYGYDPDKPKYYEDVINAMTPKTIQKFTKKLLKKPDIIDLIFKPLDD